jgi:hypothetical protein
MGAVLRNVIAVAVVAAAGLAGAATYYVDEVNGVDDPARSGGPGDPWHTITYALSRVSGENTFMCRGTFEENVAVGQDDAGSDFVGNPDAALVGDFHCENYYSGAVEAFHVYGSAHGGAQAELIVSKCYFDNPGGTALAAGARSGILSAYYCVIEDCGYAVRQTFEFGSLYFSDCDMLDCEGGINASGEYFATINACSFSNVEGYGVYLSLFYDRGEVRNCEFYGCKAGVGLRGPSGPYYGCNLSAHDSVFRDNQTGVTAGCTPRVDRYISLYNNDVIDNRGNGVEAWGEAKLRGNTVMTNDGHGVYITENKPDLGTPGDPGGNTFAGNKSGYDVYNASPEDIAAVGNTWDPGSEAEMKGKTWQEVNVTRIYDHWDDPSVGYVMWSEPMVGVAPASLGQIKASFRDGAPSEHSTPNSSVPAR